MPSVIGKQVRTASSKCFVSNKREEENFGTKLATYDSALVREGEVMQSVISISAVPKPSTSYVRCPSCHAKVQKVDVFVSRMSWDRFRCKCGYDGPLEYTASAYSGRKLHGA
jgi:hypothetical protein